MQVVAALAPEIDRLVWAVRDRVRARRPEMPASSALPAPAFNPLINLMSFPHDLSESFIRRRYTYRPEPALRAFFAELDEGGYLARSGDRLEPTDRLAPIAEEIGRAIGEAGRDYLEPYGGEVEAASAMARRAMEAGPARDGLLQVALGARESDDMYRRFWQRLSGLRLLRNEAHVDAWRSFDLAPAEVETLTHAWAGSEIQGRLVYSDRLVERGYARDGSVTAAGLAVRRQIEDATNLAVAPAFAVIDAKALLEILTGLPPTRSP